MTSHVKARTDPRMPVATGNLKTETDGPTDVVQQITSADLEHLNISRNASQGQTFGLFMTVSRVANPSINGTRQYGVCLCHVMGQDWGKSGHVP
jgi:hypothetical protein